MGKITLTAIILEPEKVNYSAQYRAVTTKEGEYVIIGIKEYVEGIKALDEQKKILQKKQSEVQSDSEITDKYYRQAKERYDKGGEWLKIEKKDGKDVSHAQISMDENIKVAKKDASTLKKNIASQLSKLETKVGEFEKSFENVVWAYNLKYKRSSSQQSRNHIFKKGTKQINVSLNQHLQGGGFAWVEPFFENSQCTGDSKFGLYIHTENSTSSIVTAEWYGYDENRKPVKIDKPVSIGDKVQLHIYTKSLYGQNIRIELKSNGKTLKANTYGTSIIIYSKKDPSKDTSKLPSSKYEVQNSKDMFLSEVEVYDYSAPGTIQPPAGAMIGNLIGEDDDFSDGSIIPIHNVQKAVLDLYIDPEWCIGQKMISIIPTIHFLGKMQQVNVPLIVHNKVGKVVMPAQANMPVFIDKIETSMEAFHPCGYNFIIVDDGARKIDLLEDKSLPPLNLFELVAGPKLNTHYITIDLDTDTTECSFDGTPSDHEKHALILSDYPEKKIEQNAKEEEESSVSRKSTIKVQIGGEKNNISSEGKLGFAGKLEKFTADGDDKQLKFKARYIYNYTPINFAGYAVHPIFRYFWLGKGVATNTYMVMTNTCRYQQNVAIKTYPDVGWSLKLSYTNSTVERELWGNKRYADTKKAKFKREPQKWIPAGEGKSIGISLGAKWDVENEFDATGDITKQVKKLVESLGAVGKFVNSVFLGDENKKEGKYKEPSAEDKETLENVAGKKEQQEKKQLLQTKNYLSDARTRRGNATTDQQRKSADRDIENLQRKMDKQSKNFDLKLTRSIGSISIQWPQLEAQFEWSLENVKQQGPFYNQTGVILQGVLELTPLIGITATLDFLALAQRAHPVALAVIAAADITMAILGDGSKITCNLTASGTFGGKLQGFLNTKTGENSFNKDDRNANDKNVAELKCDLEFKLELSIKLKIEKKKLFVKVTLTGDLGAEAVAKWEGKASIDTDDFGWYLAPEMTFQGLEVKGYANVEGQIGDKDDTWGSASSTNTFEWQAIDAWKEPKKWGKFYFPSKKE